MNTTSIFTFISIVTQFESHSNILQHNFIFLFWFYNIVFAVIVLVVLVKKSGHKKYLFFDLFFKSGHESYFLRGCFFKNRHWQYFLPNFVFESGHSVPMPWKACICKWCQVWPFQRAKQKVDTTQSHFSAVLRFCTNLGSLLSMRWEKVSLCSNSPR